MRKYKVFLSNGKTKTYRAKSPTQARYKYYGSDEHFRTEDSVIRVRRAKR